MTVLTLRTSPGRTANVPGSSNFATTRFRKQTWQGMERLRATVYCCRGTGTAQRSVGT
ncbi:hypothetical protein CERZMDRAFT_89659, partial [Cercospora zeae-maydis SCOH1-5]